MATSSNTTWMKGFSESPTGKAWEDLVATELLRQISEERILFPPGSDDAVLMTRIEALVRVLWTRAVIDADLTSIKLLIDVLDKKGPVGDAARVLFSADEMALAEALLRVAGDAPVV
jgi:hypothetical protein